MMSLQASEVKVRKLLCNYVVNTGHKETVGRKQKT